MLFISQGYHIGFKSTGDIHNNQISNVIFMYFIFNFFLACKDLGALQKITWIINWFHEIF